MHLADLVHPKNEDDFIESDFGKELCFLPGEEGRFSQLLNWRDIDHLLRFQRLSADMLMVVKGDQVIPAEAYVEQVERYPGHPVPDNRRITQRRVVPECLEELARDGASVVINSLEELHEPIADLACNLEKTLGERVYVNAYLSWGDTSGFNTHWDDHDVLILQVLGKKHWRISPPTQVSPMHGSGAPELDGATEAAFDRVITSGDVLHVPRGWWHLVTPVNEPSIHLTIGLTKRTGVHFLSWLSNEMVNEESFRTDISRRGGAPRREHLENLSKILSNYLEDESVLERYLDSHTRATPGRSRFNLDL
ncbi:cupin domain-containing protein [Streptomyces sp900105245]|uniref:Cupin domain-containing protein n=1 Tax=Streptomyces sp. 900105245 TaxID=3154379 RepID=A0ABV1UMF7_9ACTN